MRVLSVCAVWLAGALAGWAQGDRAGAFDYCVMALSWSPT